MLAVVGGMLELTDPRNRDPFSREPTGPTMEDLVESLVETPYAETTAALRTIRLLTPDQVLVDRLTRELEGRRHPMPDWMTALEQARPERDVWSLTHVLGDGDDYLLGVEMPSDLHLSALVYVDRNMGMVVKDAFLVPGPLEDLVIRMGTLIDADQTLARTDAATARAVVESAIDSGVRLYPPLESDTWPSCRPVVEWMIRMLPEGGRAPEWREWSDEERSAVVEEFLASPVGTPFDDEEHRSLMGSVLWFCTDYAPGDPWRWSPVTVEILLADWFPRKVVADPAYLALLPDLVRAYIRYCHGRQGIGRDLTTETLAAVDTYESVYREAIGGERQSAAAALARAVLETERQRDLDDDQWYLEFSAREVGGLEALMALDDSPLPDEPFDWTGIPESVRPAVSAIVDLCDEVAGALLDSEHRTAMRRLLARAARNDPRVFARKSSPARGAAAVAWIIGVGNRTVGSWSAALTTQDLLAAFGVTGSVSDRAVTLARAAGVSDWFSATRSDLGDGDLVVSSRRRALVAIRERTASR